MPENKNDKVKNILVTGGAGFIGSHLIDALLQNKSYNITSIDNYISGNVARHRNGVKYIESNTYSINEIDMPKQDIVYHLGEYSRVENSFANRNLVFENNILGTQKVIEYCVENNSKLIYAGSSTKFGTENHSQHSSPYAWTKAKNTELIVNYGMWYNLKHAICYFYNAYGEGENYEGDFATVIGIFHHYYKQSRPLPVVKPGSQLRNFTHVKDIVKGIELVGKYGEGDGYGIGHDDAYKIIDVAKMFSNDIVMVEGRKGNRPSASLETEKIKALGWKPNYSLESFIQSLKNE